MLRIFVFEEPFSVKLRLEGALTSQTVPLLTQRWADVKSGLKGRRAILDLGDLAEFDEAGQSTLRWLAESGARLGYAHPKMRALVDELGRGAPGFLGFLNRTRKLLSDSAQKQLLRWQDSSLHHWLCALLPSRVRPCGCRAT